MKAQFAVGLVSRMPEAKKGHNVTMYVQAATKFQALLAGVRKAKVSHGRIDGVQPVIESHNYICQLG